MTKNPGNKLKNKKYVHFDCKKNPKYFEHRILNREWVSKHGFYPFIHYTINFDKYVYCEDEKNFRKKNTKTRHIYYSSHIDRYIYQFYGEELNNKYNELAREYGINKASIAYRNIFKGKCNIHFAKEVIDFISCQENAFIYVADFTNFFDELNHRYLKEKLCNVLRCERLPKEHYAIYKNITNFTYVEKEDILKYKDVDKKEFNRLKQIFDTSQEFQIFKKSKDLHNEKYLKKHKDSENGKKKIGIPQGSSISAVYSNIYMLDFDKYINDYVTSNKGMYRRYCDDIIIVIPLQDKNTDYIKHIDKIESIKLKTPNLNIHDDKTSKFIFSEGKIKNIKNTSKNYLDYLGFYYDGKVVKIREKSLFKYYSRMYQKVDIVSKYSVEYGRKVFRRRLYKLYSHLGARPKNNNKGKREYGNFLTYSYKSYDIFGENNNYQNNIRLQVANHWTNMHRKLKICENKYKSKDLL
ncbi:MAG: reverse transcriptase domain-containing protein [Paraclostridium sp.]